MGPIKQLWQVVLGNLELSLSKASFTTWFKNTSILDQSSEKIIIGVPNSFTKEWLQNKFHQEILRAVRSVNPDISHIEYQITTRYHPPPSTAPNTGSAPPERQTVTKSPVLGAGLNSKYNFQNFIVGSNNELAAAAAIAVGKNPGKSYNPLFIYGGVGLGKTHLMQAVGNEFLKTTPGSKVLYVPSEKFTNEFIQAVRDNRTENFKNLYRSADVLLIDDVQFLAGKEQTQEEFFHTFNTLHQNNRQIVLSSDRLPKDIPSIEERLVSRFEWGMIADVQPPDFETRLAILRSKAKERDYEVEEPVLEYIAQAVETNIRELEGSLNRLMVFCQLNNTVPNLERVKDVLSQIIFSPKKRSVSPKRIMEIVSDYYNVTVDDLIKQSRKKEYVTPRQVAMYIIRKELETSLPMIGEIFGGRDHTTVIHAVDKVQTQSKLKDGLRHEISLLTNRVYQD
ncbi:MAG: chromosomal replication initiation protein [Parcubacteria group bacterium GW2011_GWA2_51_12]|nr:MAG: chromosomal replication initiation protein [Parcubacteria group bacterium GW2011_GWA2_51_12]